MGAGTEYRDGVAASSEWGQLVSEPISIHWSSTGSGRQGPKTYTSLQE